MTLYKYEAKELNEETQAKQKVLKEINFIQK